MCNKVLDKHVEPLDWRYSAAIVGLYKYLNYHYEENVDFRITEDAIEFYSDDITEEKYLDFVEYYYGEGLQHRRIESILSKCEFSDDDIKKVNELLKSNAVLKKVFGKVKFDGTNKENILKLIDDQRKTLIKETYRTKKNMYANYANTNQLFKPSQNCCRLLGYYVDGGRKSKAISYNFDTNTFVSQDDIIFDFIPFSFLGDYEAFFINDSSTVNKLIMTNINFEHYINDQRDLIREKGVDARKILFQSIKEVADFINFDVEIILKVKENVFFETMYVRRESIQILRGLENYEVFCRSLKINDNFYLNIQSEVLNCILNLVRTDYLIELYLKQKNEYLVSQLIKINILICGGGEHMKQSMKGAYACAKEVVRQLPENKIESYRQKLISSIIFKDYDRCCQVMLQLSNYSNVTFDFAYDLFEDFEANKDIAYTFINALTLKNKEDK